MAELVVALDYPESAPALDLARRLVGIAPWVKVGLELFVAEGPAVLSRFRDLGFKVFCDLKLHDIPATVRGATRSATRAGADMLTLHASGGERMLAAAREGRDEAGAGKGPLLMAVTVLTSLDASDMAGILAKSPAEMVLDLAVKAYRVGLDGVVCSPLEAAAVKAATGRAFKCLTPGIRLADATADDQRRTASPAEAVEAGADFLVVGRPITAAADPVAAAQRIREAMLRTAP